MSQAFIWMDARHGTAQDGSLVWTVMAKPNLGVEYSDLQYVNGAGILDGMVELSMDQVAVIAEIFANGPHTNSTEVVPAVNSDGVYIGLRPLPLADGETRVPGIPRSTDVRWDFALGVFVQFQDMDLILSRGLEAIDNAAGAARLRYITDVPGQQGTYLVKAAQAEAYVAAGGVGSVPPYVAAEASATGLDSLDAAQFILTTRDAWDDVVGPRIEELRRLYSERVKVLTSKEAIEIMVARGMSALGEV